MKTLRSGLTMVELILSTAILSMALAAVFQLSLSARASSEESAAMSILESETLRIVERLSEEFRNFSEDPASGFVMTTNSVMASPVLSYDFENGLPVYGNLVTWITIPNDGEIDDDQDNNANNLVDEMKLLRIDSDGSETVICDNVARNGLSFLKQGKKVIISLTLTAYVNRTKNRIGKTISPVTITLKN
jgi:type II secretory pathway pseudopilin PulG